MRVLTIGDLHEYASNKDYLQFIKDTYKIWQCDTINFIGDIVDWHTISTHPTEPEAPSPNDEYHASLEAIQRWYKEFPKATVCIGNHDCRPQRLAKSVNVPEYVLRDYSELWRTPGWDWGHKHIIDGVYYVHTSGGGQYPAINLSKTLAQSVVQGHVHSAAYVSYWTNQNGETFFGMNVGCGVDDNSLAMSYGKLSKFKSVMSCGIVIDGEYAYVEPMK